MCRVMLSVALVCSCATATVLAQSAGQSPAVRAPAARPYAAFPGRSKSAPPKQFDRQPDMVTVQALIVTVSFGKDGGGDVRSSSPASPAGSLAHALAEKINAEGGAEKKPISALTAALDRVLKEKAKTASIETLTGLELVTVAGQAAFVQIGHQKPKTVGVTVSQRGRSNSVQVVNVGTIMSITPQIVPDGSLVVDIDIERSGLAPEDQGNVIAKLEDGSEIRSPQIDTLTSKTTVTAANGQAVVVNDLVCSEQSLRKETFVLLRPLVIGASDDR